ncbi:MAG: hypothetical protein L0H64_17270, partial [Pseudonocardia sp.]|nr:hypothetical protein [Pseudonocardia sp.]
MSGAPRSVGARELLDGSERLWAADPVAALHCDGSPDSRHRRALVLDALRAYERLRAGSTTRTDPLAVFRRWPVCTVVALVAAPAADRPAAWLHGWATAWAHAFAGHHRPEQLAAAHPGLATLLDAAARLDPATSGGNPAEVRLDVDAGALVVHAGPGWTVEAGGSP